MAIATDSAIEFYGTKDTIHSTPATVTDSSFSVAGDVADWTNDDDALFATAVLVLKAAGLGGAPTANSRVDLYARLMNIDGTDDATVPDANFQHTFLGSFPVNDADADQSISIEISLPNEQTSQIYQFYIHNRMGVSTGTDWELYITPKAIGPHA